MNLKVNSKKISLSLLIFSFFVFSNSIFSMQLIKDFFTEDHILEKRKAKAERARFEEVRLEETREAMSKIERSENQKKLPDIKDIFKVADYLISKHQFDDKVFDEKNARFVDCIKKIAVDRLLQHKEKIKDNKASLLTSACSFCGAPLSNNSTTCFLCLKSHYCDTNCFYKNWEDHRTKCLGIISNNEDLYLASYVANYKKKGNITYIQVKTNSQFDENFLLAVKKTSEDIRRYVTVKSAYWLCKCFGSNDKEGKIRFLNFINSVTGENTFIEEVIEKIKGWSKKQKIEKTEDLSERQEIEKIISAYAFNDKSRVTVIESILEVESSLLNQITDKFMTLENYHHVFIVSTNDLRIGLLKDLAKNKNCIINEEAFEDLICNTPNKSHWYVIGIDKKGDSIQYFIVDSKGINRINDKEKFKRERYFCDWILNRKSQINLMKKFENTTGVFAIKKGIIKPNVIKEKTNTNNKPKTCQRKAEPSKSGNNPKLVRQKNIKLSKSLKKSIYDLAPERIRVLIAQYQNAMKDVKKNSDRLIKNHVEYFSHLPRTLILYGPNGTGKSSIAKLIAKEIDRKLYFINCGLLGTTYKNSEIVNLERQIYPLIENAKKGISSVVVFDEFDALTKGNNSSDKDSGSITAAIGQILDMSKEQDILFICTTNFIGNIGFKFFSRCGYELVNIELPSEDLRKKLIVFLLKERAKISKRLNGVNIHFEGLDLDLLAEKTTDFCIRTIENLVNRVYAKVKLQSNKDSLREIVITDKDFDVECSVVQENKKAILDLIEKAEEEDREKRIVRFSS